MEYTVGMKIRIVHMEDPYANYDGREGYIIHIDDMGMLHGTWGSLSLDPNEDELEVLYQYIPLYYATPCQVRWYNTVTKKWYGGICLYDYLIKGDGSMESIDHIIKLALLDNIDPEDAIVELDWIDLSTAIYRGIV